MFWSFSLVCMSVSRISYKIMDEFACIKLLSEVYLGTRHNLIHFGDDPDKDPYPGSGSGLLCLLPINKVIRIQTLQTVYQIKLFCMRHILFTNTPLPQMVVSV